MRLQQRHHTRHRRQHGYPLPLDRLHQPRSNQPAFKMHLCRKHRRNPQPHRLPEDVTQRKRVQKPQRVHELLIAQISLRALLDRPHAGQHVAVRVHDALGVAGRPRSKQDLQWRLPREAGHRPRLTRGKGTGPVLKRQRWKLESCQRDLGLGMQLPQQHGIPHRHFGPHIRRHPCRKIRAPKRVQRNDHRPAQHAPVKRRDPLRAVLGP